MSSWHQSAAISKGVFTLRERAFRFYLQAVEKVHKCENRYSALFAATGRLPHGWNWDLLSVPCSCTINELLGLLYLFKKINEAYEIAFPCPLTRRNSGARTDVRKATNTYATTEDLSDAVFSIRSVSSQILSTQLATWSWALVDSHQYSMEPEVPLLRSQEHYTCPYPEPDQSSPHHDILSLEDIL
jgi:hypothetical protein